jgi:hypothetical protein
MRARSVLILLGLLAVATASADFKPDYAAMIRDLEMTSKSGQHLTIVIWLPGEYWRASLQHQTSLTPEGAAKFIKALDPYVIVAAVDGEIGFAGAIDYTDEAALRKLTFIEDSSGGHLQPLEPDTLPTGVRNVVDMMHPMFSNMMGAMGAHIQVFVFPAMGKDGTRIAEVTKSGSFTVHVGVNSYRYRLPLGSFLPPMIDAKTGESFPGNYHFNPFTGDTLAPAAADK